MPDTPDTPATPETTLAPAAPDALETTGAGPEPRDAPDEAALGTVTDAVIDTVTITQQQALETIEAAGVAVLAGLSSLQREMADFVTARICTDMETRCALLRCATLGEVRALQARRFASTLDQYAAQAARLMTLGVATMAKSLNRGA